MNNRYFLLQPGFTFTFFLMGFLLFHYKVTAQSVFQKAIGVDGLEKAESMDVLQDGYIVVGQTSSYGIEQRDMFVVRTNEKGKVIWTKTYGGPERETINDIITAPTGGFLIAGEKYRYQSTEGEFSLITKISDSGDTEWKKVYHEGENETEVYSIHPTSDGGFIFSGITRNLNPMGNTFFNVQQEQQSVYILKIDANGIKKWSKSFKTGNAKDVSTSALDMCATHDGGFLITGNIAKESGNNPEDKRDASAFSQTQKRNMLLIKLDQHGKLQWSMEYDANRILMGYAVAQSNNGDYIVSGVTNTGSSRNIDAFITAVSGTGEIIWSKTYGGLDYEAVSGMVLEDNGDIVISGVSRSAGFGLSDAMLFKVDAQGNVIWSKVYGGEKVDVASCLRATKYGYVLAGSTASRNSESTDMYLIQTDKDGKSGCQEMDINLNVGGLSILVSKMPQSFTDNINQEITSSSFQRMNANKVVEISRQTNVKNFCD